MSSIFVSAIPKSVSRYDVEWFLHQSFPTCNEVNVLRAAGNEETHKGHAYVLFDNAQDAETAFAAYSQNSPVNLTTKGPDVKEETNNNVSSNKLLILDNSVLRLRLSTAVYYNTSYLHERKKEEEEHAEPLQEVEHKKFAFDQAARHAEVEHNEFIRNDESCSRSHHEINNKDHVKDKRTTFTCTPLPPAYLHCYWKCCLEDKYHVYDMINNTIITQNVDTEINDKDLPLFRYAVPWTAEINKRSCKHEPESETYESLQHEPNIQEQNKSATLKHTSETILDPNVKTNSKNSKNKIVSKEDNSNIYNESCNTNTYNWSCKQLSCILEFNTPEDCERAIECAPHRFTKIGPLSLEELFQPHSLTSTLSHSRMEPLSIKRQRISSNDDDDDDSITKKQKCKNEEETTLERWRDEGYMLLTPMDALKELEKLFSGQGRVAVKDEFGTIAILRVPTYAASIE